MKKLIYIALFATVVGCAKEEINPADFEKCYICESEETYFNYGSIRIDTIRKDMCGMTLEDVYNYEVAETYRVDHRANTYTKVETKCTENE